MKKIKKIIQSLKDKYQKKQGMFIIAAVILFGLLCWSIIANFVFIVDELNNAFGAEITAEQTTTEFDKEAFQKLDLIQ